MSFKYFVVLVGVVCAIDAAKWQSSGPSPDPANPDHCLFKDHSHGSHESHAPHSHGSQEAHGTHSHEAHDSHSHDSNATHTHESHNHEVHESHELHDDLSIPKGETVSLPGHCAQITCHQDLSWQGVSCPAVVAKDGECKVIDEDLTKEYPDCCAKVECP